MITDEETIASLIKLLEANRSVPGADDCIRELHKERFPLRVPSPLPVRRLLDVSSVRAKHVRDNDLPIKGMDELVVNLENTDRLLGKIYDVPGMEHLYLIFTDDRMKTLFGLVTIPSEGSEEWKGKDVKE
jgi:hypothetical protein